VLQRSNIGIANVFDTLAASRRIRGRQPGGHSLAAVCRRELDKVIDKTLQTSDWTRRPLSAAQVAYAALDVEVLVQLFTLFRQIQPELALA
jgi:ribonuclease D